MPTVTGFADDAKANAFSPNAKVIAQIVLRRILPKKVTDNLRPKVHWYSETQFPAQSCAVETKPVIRSGCWIHELPLK